jgi:alkylhydroperoxidase/carboxymuconolactone decarboxylase family protein YurZ
MANDNKPPAQLKDYATQYPDVWRAFTALARACHEEGGPLDEKCRRVAKLAVAVGMRHEGAVHSAVRHALASGVTPDAIRHVAVLSVTTLGWPAARAAMTWIDDVLGGGGGAEDDPE